MRALDDHTNKAIVIEVYDEKGKNVKEDWSSYKKEEIRIRLTRKKQKDGTYVGHFEYVDKDGNVRENYGGNQTCLYQAVYQAESSEQQNQESIVQGAAGLRKQALNRMDSSLLESLDQRRQVYRASAGPGGKFSLEGGFKRTPTTNNPQEQERTQRRLQRDANKTVEEALEDHIPERIEGLAEAYKLAKQACPDLFFDEMFQEAANLQDGKGSRTSGKIDIHERDATEIGKTPVNDFNKVDAAHTTSLGLKDVPEKKIKDKVVFAQLEKKLAHTNLLPQFYKITFDKKLDEAHLYELKRQFDSGTSFNKEAFMEHAHDRVQKYGASQQEILGSLRQTEATKRKVKLFEKSTRWYCDQLKPSNSTKRVRKP